MTSSVLESAVRAGVRRVFLASSAVVYRDTESLSLNEDSSLVRPDDARVSGYVWSKITDELMSHWFASEFGLDVVLGRFTNVYGPEGVLAREPSTVVHQLVRRALQTRPPQRLTVFGDGTPRRSFLHVADAADAVLTVLKEGAPQEVYNIDSGYPTPIRDLAGIIAHEVDSGLELSFLGGERGTSRVLSAEKLRSLGFRPSYSLRAGIADVVEQCRGRIE